MGLYGVEQRVLLNDMLRLRDAKVLAAEYNGSELTVSVELESRNIIRTYKM